MELFDQIWRESELGSAAIQGGAKKLGVRWRMVREAMSNALPAPRKNPERKPPRGPAGLSCAVDLPQLPNPTRTFFTNLTEAI